MPIELPNRNVFVSLNYEFNYGIPRSSSDLVVPWLNETTGNIAKRSLLNRQSIYEMLIERMNFFIGEYLGEECLERVICETAEKTFTEGNGVLGELVHILLTPSSSMNEDIDNKYYLAEEYGRNAKNDECDKYKIKCEINFLNLFSELNPDENELE